MSLLSVIATSRFTYPFFQWLARKLDPPLQPSARPAFPDQPLIVDAQGVTRFRKNEIVRYILDNGGIDLNHIGCKDFSADDQMQFAQLIGYSVSGYSELDYVTDEAYESAEALSAKLTKSKQRTK